ncbi:MAG: hypothetical protein ACI31R_00850 [Bacilli bacterium]
MIEMKKFNIEDLTRYNELMNNYYKLHEEYLNINDNDNDNEKRSELLEKMIVVLEELINYSDVAKNILHNVKCELKLLKENK